MTPKLMDRLARLESAQAPMGGASEMPRETVHAWLRAVAVALGDYPRPRRPAPSCLTDSIGEGFARGLGYVDQDDMEVQATADPGDWQRRIEGASVALRERYRADAGFAAEADDGAALLHAVAFYGAANETTGTVR